ncbi:cyclic nucleotide-gated cation channel alpha-3-like [Dendronephthya gigantea]|uniref:cyclic nucleotide-gated cation channel alpha-3-like n=1 Tax=Dendronephthya gigantea TaxID=151771 RepID=UPI00106BF25F|nr:cyclic nucleotide-gated cation channel alpha-3-like [Dendronephthya gigantea]
MSEKAEEHEMVPEQSCAETDDDSSMDTLSIPGDPRNRWEWLKQRFWEERSNKVQDVPQNRPQRTRKRKQSVVDPFLKRFSTRELHGLHQHNHLSPIPIAIHPPEMLYNESSNKDYEIPKVNQHNHQTKWGQSVSILDPKSTAVYVWNCVLAIAIFYHFWTIIFRIAFHDESSISRGVVAFLVFDYSIDLIFILDILISSRISFLQNGILVQDVKRVAFTYLFTRNFYLDIVAILPVDFLYLAFGVTPALRLIRLIKVYKLIKVRTSVESMSSSPALLRASILVHSMFLLIHWNASFYFMISKHEGLGSNEWVYPALNGSFDSLTRKYARSFYWSTLTLTAIGDLPAPATDLEYLYTICCYLCGVFMFATVVGNIGSIILNRNSNKIVFEQQRDEARNYMEERKVPKELQERVLLWYDYAYQRGRINGVDDLNSLNLLPHKMKTELAIHIHLDTLKKVSFLQKCQPEFLHDLLLKMKLTIYTPGDLIIRRGEIAREMYLISDGIVQIIGESGDVLKELGTGDFFGEIGILNLSGGQNRRIADVRSVGYTECFMLLREDVLAATRDYPEAQEILSAYGKERLNRTRKVSSTWRGGAPAGDLPDPNRRWPQFELQVVRESVSSVRSRENEGFTKDEDTNGSLTQDCQNFAAKKESSGRFGEKISTRSNRSSEAQENDAKNIKKSSNADEKNSIQNNPRASQVQGVEKRLSQELETAMKVKEKEVSLLNDVIQELQREKENDKKEMQNLKTKHQSSQQRLETVEEENTKLRQENKAKDGTIEILRNKIEQLQRTRNEKKKEDEIVITEVNECDENC